MWEELLLEAGLNEREVRSILILGSRPKMKASELAKPRSPGPVLGQRSSSEDEGGSRPSRV